jgi:hypothetical protein
MMMIMGGHHLEPRAFLWRMYAAAPLLNPDFAKLAEEAGVPLGAGLLQKWYGVDCLATLRSESAAECGLVDAGQDPYDSHRGSTYGCLKWKSLTTTNFWRLALRLLRTQFIVSTAIWRLGIILTIWERGIWASSPN